MKRFVAACPATDVIIIVAVNESVIVPPEGAIISIPCPCCQERHAMKIRDAKHIRHAS